MPITVKHIKHRLENAAKIGYSLEELGDDLCRMDHTEDSLRALIDLPVMEKGVEMQTFKDDKSTFHHQSSTDLLGELISILAEGSFEDMVGGPVLRTERFDIFWRDVQDIQEAQVLLIDRKSGDVSIGTVDTHCFGEDFQTGYCVIDLHDHLVDTIFELLNAEDADSDGSYEAFLATTRETLQLSLGRIGDDAYVEKALKWVGAITEALHLSGHELAIEARGPKGPKPA